MPPYVFVEQSTLVMSFEEVNELLFTKAQKWSCAADDGSSDYDALAATMNLGRKEIVELLLEKGSRVINHGTSSSPLHMTIARMGWSTVVEKLMSLGAKVSDRNSNGDTALHLAFVNESTDSVIDKLLTKYLNATTRNVENNDGLNLMHIASTRTTSTHVQTFIDRKQNSIDCQVSLRSVSQYAGFTPLHFAVAFGRFEIAELLLANGASIYVQDRLGSTPVHLALYTGDTRMIDLLFAYDKRNENCIDNFGLTHFMAACAGSVLGIVEQFLHRKPFTTTILNSRVGDFDNNHPYAGYSPIHFAAAFGNIEMVRLLLTSGASCFAMTTDNWSPMAIARYYGHENVLRLLHKHCSRQNHIFVGDRNCFWPKY